MESVQFSNAYFIHCLLPHHTAAVCKPLTSTANHCSLNMQLLRTQLRALQLMDALLLQKQGSYYDLCKKTTVLNTLVMMVAIENSKNQRIIFSHVNFLSQWIDP